MQWAIDAFCGLNTKKGKSKVVETSAGKYQRKLSDRMSYCVSCKSVWEKDRNQPNYIFKYQGFPTWGIKRKECKYCE